MSLLESLVKDETIIYAKNAVYASDAISAPYVMGLATPGLTKTQNAIEETDKDFSSK